VATILVVDDAPVIRLLAKEMLAELGHTIIEASNGKEAVEAFQTYHPDGVLLDASMPVMDGLAALRAIKNVNPKARVIMVTALGEEAAIREAILLGATDYVVKPFKKARLVQAVERMLA
jgi:two-component system chemotaxis response regulator CheY